jgi:hypothetical protein
MSALQSAAREPRLREAGMFERTFVRSSVVLVCGVVLAAALGACGARPGVSALNDAGAYPVQTSLTEVMSWAGAWGVAPGVTGFNDASLYPWRYPAEHTVAWMVRRGLVPGITPVNDYDWSAAP